MDDPDDLTPEQIRTMPHDDAVAAVMQRDDVSRFLAEQVVAFALAGGDIKEIG